MLTVTVSLGVRGVQPLSKRAEKLFVERKSWKMEWVPIVEYIIHSNGFVYNVYKSLESTTTPVLILLAPPLGTYTFDHRSSNIPIQSFDICDNTYKMPGRTVENQGDAQKKGPRKLVLCFDGTGNTFTGSNSDTNVVKLLHMLDRNAPDQYHYYQSQLLFPLEAPGKAYLSNI